jgi:pimeloyl-ACP methyl ester carboxylesterase
MLMRSAVAEIREVSISGYTGRFMQRGDGPAVLLIASQLVRINPYRPLFLRLSEHLRVTVLELPGCGGASTLRRGWSCEQYADWLEKFVEEEQIKQPLLIAHSTSCGAAMLVAAGKPDLVGGLILCGSIGIARPVLSVLLGRLLDGVIEWRLSLRRWFDVVHTSIFHTRNFFHQIRIAATHDLTQTASRIKVPALLAHGRRDHSVPLSSAQALHELIPQSRLYISPTGSHDWLITHPNEFAAMTRSFAESIGSRFANPESTAVSSDPLSPSPLRWPVPQ